MTSLATDAFTRANAALTTPWSNAVGGWTGLSIFSNAVGTTGGANSDSEAVYDGGITWPNDQYSQVKITTVGGADGGPCIRAGTGDGYFVTAFTGSTIELFRLSGFANIGTYNTRGYQVNDVIKIQAQGTTIKVFLNGAQIISVTDTNVTSGKPGIHLFDGTMRVDDFDAGNLQTGYTLAAGQGAYSLTGQTTTLTKSGSAKTITAGQGTYSLSGQTSVFVRGRKLAAAQGTYNVVGSAARIDNAITAVKGTYTLTGQTAGGGKTGNATLPAGQGTYAFSGQASTLIRGRTLVAVSGNYNLTGTAAAFQTSMPTTNGVYTLTGQNINLLYSGTGSKTMPAAQGSYAMTGQSVNLKYAKGIGAGQGGYVIAGQPVALLYSGQPGLPDNGRYMKKKVFAISPVGKVKWVDYIPVHQHPEVLPVNADRYNDNGAITVQILSSVTGLTAWRDYIPIVDVGSGGRWRFDSNGYVAIIPVF